MDYVKKRTHVIGHPKFLEAGPHARDLWDWGMLWCGLQETDGEIPFIAVATSAWGKGSAKANLALAERLVALGLWAKTKTGYRVLQWTEQGNVTKAQLIEAREAARERMKKRRTPPAASSGTAVRSDDVRANITRTSPEVPTSTSTSTSLSSGSSGDPEEREGLASPGTGDAGPMPPWFEKAAETVTQAIGLPVAELPARWLEYASARHRKGWAMNQRDAVGWLTAVVRGERERARTRPPTKAIVQSAEGRAWELPEEVTGV